MHSVRFSLISICGVLVALPGCGGIENASEKQSEVNIVGGTEVWQNSPGPSYASTGALVTTETMQKGKSFCSGTLLHPRIMMTAAHCVMKPDGTPLLNEPFYVQFGHQTGNRADLTRKVIATRTHEEASLQDALAEVPRIPPNDIALLLLDAPVESPFAPRPLFEGTLEPGSEILLGGYGVKGSTLVNTTGVLREVVVRVGEIQTQARRFIAKGSFRGACSGDSGGPAFVRTSSGWYVTGVTSAGSQIFTYCSGESGYTDASRYGDWIRRTARTEFGIRM